MITLLSLQSLHYVIAIQLTQQLKSSRSLSYPLSPRLNVICNNDSPYHHFPDSAALRCQLKLNVACYCWCPKSSQLRWTWASQLSFCGIVTLKKMFDKLNWSVSTGVVSCYSWIILLRLHQNSSLKNKKLEILAVQKQLKFILIFPLNQSLTEARGKVDKVQ